jgi:hypothetical protein
MTDKESLRGIEQEVQIEERTRHAMETYVNWLQNAMSASIEITLPVTDRRTLEEIRVR